MKATRFTDALALYGMWRLTHAHYSTNTWRGERPGLEAFGRFLGNPLVQAITAEAVARWWEQLDLADSTKGTRLAQLRSFFRYAVQRGWAAKDPTALLRAPRTVPAPREQLAPEQLLRLLDVARTPRDRCLLAVAMNLAVRGSEAAAIRVRDVNWRDQSIRVWVDKTGQVDDMPMSSDLLSEVARWMLAYTGALGHTPHPNHYLLPSQHIAPSGTVTYRPTFRIAEPFEPVKRALAASGFDTQQEGVHTIRRSVARIYFDMVEESESFDSALLATMTLLHHARPDTTLAYIGRDRATLARDRIVKGKPFLSAMPAPALTVVAS